MEFNSWFAGLIESDGSIIVPETRRDNKGRLRYPAIKIVFHVDDLPLAKRLIEILGGGVIEYSKGKSCVLWFRSAEDLQKIIGRINGHIRTPKIEALHRLLLWFNNSENPTNYSLLGPDTSPKCRTVGWLVLLMEMLIFILTSKKIQKVNVSRSTDGFI